MTPQVRELLASAARLSFDAGDLETARRVLELLTVGERPVVAGGGPAAERVRAYLEANPGASVREAAAATGVPRSTVSRLKVSHLGQKRDGLGQFGTPRGTVAPSLSDLDLGSESSSLSSSLPCSSQRDSYQEPREGAGARGASGASTGVPRGVPKSVPRDVPRDSGTRDIARPAPGAMFPDRIEITPDVVARCKWAGAPVPTEQDAAACLDDARSKGRPFADWGSRLVRWQTYARDRLKAQKGAGASSRPAEESPAWAPMDLGQGSGDR